MRLRKGHVLDALVEKRIGEDRTATFVADGPQRP